MLRVEMLVIVRADDGVGICVPAEMGVWTSPCCWPGGPCCCGRDGAFDSRGGGGGWADPFAWLGARPPKRDGGDMLRMLFGDVMCSRGDTAPCVLEGEFSEGG